jgi:hypothetical protein
LDTLPVDISCNMDLNRAIRFKKDGLFIAPIVDSRGKKKDGTSLSIFYLNPGLSSKQA